VRIFYQSLQVTNTIVTGSRFKNSYETLAHTRLYIRRHYRRSGDGKGHVEVTGVARNQFHTGTKLTFKMELDQAYLPAIARALANINP
jgi:hypothetical protein